MRRIFLLILVLLCGYSPASWAQREFATWCFGRGGPITVAQYNGIRIDFTATGPNHPAILWRGGYTNWSGQGNATIADAVGNLRLHCDGIGLVDSTKQNVPNGDLNGVTGGSPWFGGATHQPVAMAPAPGNDHDEYVFYWQQATVAGQPAFALSWARVDMRQHGGLGAVMEKGQVLTQVYNPCVTVVRHRNNRDYWVLTRDLDGRGFQAFRLGRAGVDPVPVVSLAGQAQYSDEFELKAAPTGTRLACGAAARTAAGSETMVCVYDFDNATGVVSHEQIVRRQPVPPLPVQPNGRPVAGQLATSSCSFSPNGQLLYTAEPYLDPTVRVRRFNDMWQYDLAQPTLAAVAASRFQVSAVPVPAEAGSYITCYGLQLTPDGTLWAAQFYHRSITDPATGRLRSFAAAIVRHPNVAGAGCGFEPEGYTYLPGQVPDYWLPNVITNMLYAPAALNYEAACPDDSVQFWASSAGDPAGLRWDFGEPGSGAANQAQGRLAAHRYAQGGTYAVRLTLADGRVLAQTVAVAGAATDFTAANVFTPNGDGYNDWFVPVRAPLPGGQLRVFSRWGQPVFSTTEAALRWDGAGAAAGEYFYELAYPDCQGTVQHRRGVLTLVR